MLKIKKGDIVGRISYNFDIIFVVKDIFDVNNAILEGLFVRLIADSNIEDLDLISNEELNKQILERKWEYFNAEKRVKGFTTGKILHLDGDRKYSGKSLNYYKKMGLTAVVKNVSESKQPYVIYDLLSIVNPDIVVITGHDGMFRKERDFYNIYNYRNSKYFVKTVMEARRFERNNGGNLVIFAGACQSYFEALIQAGANFASSPARILIDIFDPLIVAKKIATTDRNKYVRIEDFESELRDGTRGISGVGAMRKNERNIFVI